MVERSSKESKVRSENMEGKNPERKMQAQCLGASKGGMHTCCMAHLDVHLVPRYPPQEAF